MATNVLQHAKIDPQFSLGYNLHTAMTRHGRSPWSQVREIWQLRYGPGRLRPDEYYYYGLYDDRRFACAEKERFLGRTVQDQIIRQCNAAEWWFVAHDKLVCYGLLAGLGLPVPETRALYHGAGRFAAVPAFATPEALAAHLRTKALPFFGKPVTGIRSIGVAAVDHYDAGSDGSCSWAASRSRWRASSRRSSPIARTAICSRKCCNPIRNSPHCAARVCPPCV